jgi:hypothetical protein
VEGDPTLLAGTEADADFASFVSTQPDMAGWSPGKAVPPSVLKAFLSYKIKQLASGNLAPSALESATKQLALKYEMNVTRRTQVPIAG